jgi:large subunit ribosomal protein L10
VAVSKAKKKLGGPRIGGDGPRQAKAEAVDEVERKVSSSSAVLLSEYRGLTVAELRELRAGLRAAGAEYKVYKNTLAKRAADKLGLAELHEHLEGPTAFTFAGGDPVLAAKALADYAKKVPALVLKAGILEGRVLTSSEVTRLGSLDSREVMLAKAAGLFVTPLQQLANLLAAGFNQLGAVLVQLRDKLPGEATPGATDAPGGEASPASTGAPPSDEAGGRTEGEGHEPPADPAEMAPEDTPDEGETQEG